MSNQLKLSDKERSAIRKFMLWRRYNMNRIFNSDITNILLFEKATCVVGRHCVCDDPSKFVDMETKGDNWHCTYCLKPIKEENS